MRTPHYTCGNCPIIDVTCVCEMRERANEHFITKVYSPTPSRRNETISSEMAPSPSSMSWLSATGSARFTGPQVPPGMENIVMDSKPSR